MAARKTLLFAGFGHEGVVAAFWFAVQYYSYVESGALAFLVVHSPDDPALFARGVAFQQSDPRLYLGNFSAIFRFFIDWLASYERKEHILLQRIWDSPEYAAVKDVKGECARSPIGDFTFLLSNILRDRLSSVQYTILEANLTELSRQENGSYIAKTDAVDEKTRVVHAVYFSLGRVPKPLPFKFRANDVAYFWYDVPQTDRILATLAGNKNASIVVAGGNKTAYECVLYAAEKGFIGTVTLVAPSPCHFIDNSPETKEYLNSRLTYNYVEGKLDGDGEDEKGRYVLIKTPKENLKPRVDTVLSAAGISELHPLYSRLPELIESVPLKMNSSFCHENNLQPLLTYRTKLGDKFRCMMHDLLATLACIWNDETDPGGDIPKTMVNLAGNGFRGSVHVFVPGTALDEKSHFSVPPYEADSFLSKTQVMVIKIHKGRVPKIELKEDGSFCVIFREEGAEQDSKYIVNGVMDMDNGVLNATTVDTESEERSFLRPKYSSIAGSYPFLPYECNFEQAEQRASGCGSSDFRAKIDWLAISLKLA